MTSPWMNARSVAEYLDFPLERIYKLAQRRRIPCRRQDGRLLFHRDEVDRWLNSLYAGPQEFGPLDP